MDFLALAQSRYSTKKYNPEEKISDEKIEQLKEILRLSPSSINSQPWKFTIVADEQTKRQLAAASMFNEQKINEASHLVVFSAIDNLSRFEEQIKEHLPEGAVAYYNSFLKNQPQAEVKNWLQHQVYIALGFFLSASASLDIDSTPMEGIQSEAYKQILGLDDYKPLFAVALGYRNHEDANQPAVRSKSRLPLDLVLHSV